MPIWLRHQLLILALAAPVLFYRLGDARLWDRDEPRNARCAVEMLERNDWIVPYFNNELRTHKPVLVYWLMMSSYAVFGVNEFAARFWSAALGLGTILCTYHLAARLFHRQAGLWAALALTPALMFNVASRAATPDAPLIFFVAASLAAYVRFAFPDPEQESPEPPSFPRPVWQAALVYALVALAVLAKGPVGLVLPGAIIGLSLLVSRMRWSGRGFTTHHSPLTTHSALKLLVEVRPFVLLAMLLLIAAPWYVWVGYRTDGEFLRGFFWEHNVRRATETMEGHRGPAFVFYPLTLLAGFFPASIFLIPSLTDAGLRFRRGDKQSASIIFCVTWVLVVVGLFSLAKTKLPSYVTPCYPALAALVGAMLHRWTAGSLAISRWWLRVSVAWLAIVGVVISRAIYLLAEERLPGEQWLAALGCLLIAGGLLALVSELRGQGASCTAAVSLGCGLAFSMLLLGLGASAADRHQQSHLLVAAIGRGRSTEVAALHCLEPSWVFYARRPIREIDDNVADYLAQGNRQLILREAEFQALSSKLPHDVEILARVPLFLKDDTLLVLGRRLETATKAVDSPKTR